MKKKRMGRSPRIVCSVLPLFCPSLASLGRRLGRPPPNWWTRIPGPPPKLKTN